MQDGTTQAIGTDEAGVPQARVSLPLPFDSAVNATTRLTVVTPLLQRERRGGQRKRVALLLKTRSA